MSLCFPSPRRPGDDIQIYSTLGIHMVKPVSAKAASGSENLHTQSRNKFFSETYWSRWLTGSRSWASRLS
jgi:hypothetical protein